MAEYLKDLNATQAAIRCGYPAKTARSVGSENLTKPKGPARNKVTIWPPGPIGETHLWAAASLLLAHNALALHRSARLAAASNLGSPDGHLIRFRALTLRRRSPKAEPNS